MLDKSPLFQKLNRVVGSEKGFRQYIWGNLVNDKPQAIEYLTETFVNSEAFAEQMGGDFVRYIHSNRDSIQI